MRITPRICTRDLDWPLLKMICASWDAAVIFTVYVSWLSHDAGELGLTRIFMLTTIVKIDSKC